MMEQNMNLNQSAEAGCPKPCRTLPAMVAPVKQRGVDHVYRDDEALNHGTLFPELFKPLHNRDIPIPRCPADRVQAMSFAMWDLRLYLDTHPRDEWAWLMLYEYDWYLDHINYATAFLPRVRDKDGYDWLSEHFRWLEDPWPWEYQCCRPEPAQGGETHVCV